MWKYLVPFVLLMGCRSEPAIQLDCAAPPIVLVGDSITVGTGAAEGRGYAALLARSVSTKVVARSGRGYQDFTQNEIAPYLKHGELLVLNLGTNNIYSPGKSIPPDEMVERIAALIAGLPAEIIIAVPPQAIESKWPTQKAPYADYVKAIADYAGANGYKLIRHDLSKLSGDPAYYKDGVHPNDKGHRIMGETVCAAIRR